MRSSVEWARGFPRPGGDGRFILWINNTQAVAAVNNAVAGELLALAVPWTIDIVAIHIPGGINVKADALSRPSKHHPLSEPSSADQALAPALRVQLERRLNVRHTADAFADGLGSYVMTHRGRWRRNSFFNHPIHNEDWLTDPVYSKLDQLVRHLSANTNAVSTQRLSGRASTHQASKH